MSNPYDSQAISGYNIDPPPDDGSEIASNQVKWATQKGKLSDPIKTLSEGINTEIIAAFDELETRSGIISVKDSAYGATGNGSTDDTTAIQAAIDAGSPVYIPPGTYRITQIVLPSNCEIFGAGRNSILRAVAISTDHMVTAVAKTGITIRDLAIDGQDAAGTARGIFFSGGTNLHARNLIVTDTPEIGIFFDDVNGASNDTSSSVIGCYAKGCGGQGIRAGGTTKNLLIEGNHVLNNSLHGILLNGDATFALQNIAVVGNFCRENAQKGIAVNENVSNVTVTGNLSRDNTEDGISFLGRYGTISGNTCVNNGLVTTLFSGIVLNGASDVAITGNFCAENALSGIDTGALQRGTITGNVCRANDGIGIELNGCANVSCTGNTATANNVTTIAQASGVGAGIYVAGGVAAAANIVVSSNIVGSGTNQEYGIFARDSTNGLAEVVISSNHLSGAGSINDLLVQEASVRCNNNFLASDTVASATTITILDDDDGFINVTGTTNIQTINTDGGVNVAGRHIYLRFAGALTMVDNTGNLKLAGNFVTTGDDALHLMNDGANWVEVSRSVN